MEDFQSRKCTLLWIAGCILLFFSSCVNTISDEPSSGKIPISLEPFIQSRVTNNKFDAGDIVGLFLLSGNQPLTGIRYLDNTPYSSQTGKPQSGETIFYPAGDDPCTFISYYPFKEYALNAGSSSTQLSVQEDQRDLENYANSDFLSAISKDVIPSSKAIALKFEHKLSLLNVIIAPTAETDANEILQLKPEIVISDVYTQCSYDMQNGNTTNLKARRNIYPNGTWTISDGKLTGKSAIVMPQTIPSGATLFVISVNGRSFECKTSAELNLQNSSKSTVTIPLSHKGIGTMEISISDWLNGSDGSTSITTSKSGLLLSTLDFGKSNVHDIYNNGNIVAQICREYLSASNINEQAIVAYPYSKGKADLTRGVVLKLMKTAGKVGGKVVWNSNRLTYTPGDKEENSKIFIDSNGNIQLTEPTSSLAITAQPEVIVDNRKDETNTYSIVKIASQYWMARELSTKYYNDGTEITQKTTFKQSDLTPGLVIANEGKSYLYNYSTVDNGNLAPQGWNMPQTSDWQALLSYVNYDTGLLKSINLSTPNSPATNETYFNTEGKGVITCSKEEYSDPKSAVGIFKSSKEATSFWGVSAEGKVAVRHTIVKGYTAVSSHTIDEELSIIGTRGCSIRCIRK